MADRYGIKHMQGRTEAFQTEVSIYQELSEIGKQRFCGGEEGISELIMALPLKYKEVVYLHCYEGYQASEISGMLHCPASTVRNQLLRARKLLKKDGV